MIQYFALHGFTGTERSFEQLDLETVHCASLGGHGQEADLSRANFTEEVAHFCEMVRAANRRPVHLLGYSMGARIGLAMLLSQPQLFSGASLIGVNPGLETQAQREERHVWENRWISLLEDEGLDKFEAAWSSQELFASQHGLTSELRERQRMARLSHTTRGLAHAMGTLGLGQMPNLWTQLPGLSVTTQLIVGENDTKFSTIAKRMSTVNPLFQPVYVANAGHNPLLECPDEVRRILLESSSSTTQRTSSKVRP